MLSFTYMLLIFFAVLTGGYLTLLLKNEKLSKPKIISSSNILNIIYFAISVLLILLLFFKYYMNTSIAYFLIYPIIVFLILVAIVKSSDSHKIPLLVLTILLHLIVLSNILPRAGIMLTERTPALFELAKYNFWDPEWLLINPYYNPFPMDLGLILSVSEVTGIHFTQILNEWIITVFFIIGFDTVIFSISNKIGGSWKAGVLGVILLTFTPTANLNIQPQFIADFFIFIFIFALFIALKNSPTFSSVIILNLIYVVSILAHGTTAIGLVFVSVLFLFLLFGRRIGLNVTSSARHRSFIFTVFISIFVITLSRWILVGGVEPVVAPLQSLIEDLLGVQKVIWIGSEYVPLYDTFVSPILSYAWCVPVSFSTVYVLYHLIRRSKTKSLNTVFASSLTLAAAGLTIAGFVGGVFMAHGNLQRYLGYSGMILFVPVAGVACAKILNSSSKKIVSICLVSVMLFSGIAIFDPAFSRQIYPDLQTVNPTKTPDLIEGNTLFTIFSGKSPIISTYEMITAFDYLDMVSETPKIRLYATSLKVHRIYAANLTDTQVPIPDVTYVLSPDVLESLADAPVNVIYNSGRHVAVGGN